MTQYLDPKTVRETVAAKGTKFATVTFIKKDGTPRVKNGLFKPHSKIKGTGRPTPAGYIAIYSPGEGKWGSFSVDRVISIN